MEERFLRSGCLEKLSTIVAFFLAIVFIRALYAVVLASTLFEGPSLQTVYAQWPGLLETVAQLNRDRLADALVELAGGFMGVIFYPFFRAIRGLLAKTAVFCLAVLVSMWPIAWIISDRISSGSTGLVHTWQFRYWNSVSMAFLGGFVAIWMFDAYMPKWEDWWQRRVWGPLSSRSSSR